VSATLPAAPQVRPASPAAPPPEVASTGHSLWAVITADRTFYDRNGVTEVQFPLGAPERAFPIQEERVTIGRHSASRGIRPTIDLSEPPEDAAVSHGHATLIRQPDGSYVLVDNGSTNGTYLNGSRDPIAPHEPVAVSVGDHFNLGAWTNIRIDERSATA
jgi:pSer/pThr/pTyr-binding forkhead associated (FHA) protein